MTRTAKGYGVYKETCEALRHKRGMALSELSRSIGYDQSWLSNKFSSGYAIFSAPEMKLLCIGLGCTENELTASPKQLAETPENKCGMKSAPYIDLDAVASSMANTIAAACKYDGATARQHEELHETIRAGFAMLHSDLRNLIETMDKYWKPSPMPTIDRGQAGRNA